MLKEMLKKFIKNAAFRMGVTITRTRQTKSADVLELIRRLRPKESGRGLIRIGGNGDGGYLLPDDLEGIEYCFSPGVGGAADFENHLANLNIQSFLADNSIDHPPIERPEFTFDRKFIGANETETSFTIKSWIDKYLKDYSGELLLQMDIEGFEYEALIGTPVEALSRFRIMIIEFHNLDRIFDPFIYTLYRTCFERILRHFHVVHIHPNNCCGSVKKDGIEVPRVLEFTFYNKSRVSHTTYAHGFPHPLDRDNVPANKSIHLPRCWYCS
jgi:methyltransferase FkbM-like protein